MEQVEFEVKNGDTVLKCRPKKMSATEYLGLEAVINRDEVSKAQYMYTQILERVEVKILDTWQPLKQLDSDVYCPADLADKPGVLYKICTLFLTKVLFPLFIDSKELKK